MKKLLVLLVMLVTMSANAQWVKLDTITYGMCMTSVGSNLFVGTFLTQNAIRYSSNGGNNWVDMIVSPNMNHLFRGMATIGNTVFAVNAAGFSATTNLGANWTVLFPTINALNMKLYNNNIIVGSYNGIYISSNSGVNWTNINVDNKYIRGLFTTSTKIVAGGRQFGGVYVSTNGGYNFTNIGLNDQYIVSVALAGNTYIAGTDTAGIYTSTNEGANWTKVNISAYPRMGVTEFSVSGSNVFAATGYGCFVSNDYGVNWTMRNEGSLVSPISFYISNGYLYSVGMGTYRRPLSELTNVNNISTETPSKYSLSQNYPNPFNPTTNIKFSIVNTGEVKLVVYDIQGREVQTLVNESLKPGTYESTFDASALNSGVYFYKLITGTFSETKKMLLIK